MINLQVVLVLGACFALFTRGVRLVGREGAAATVLALTPSFARNRARQAIPSDHRRRHCVAAVGACSLPPASQAFHGFSSFLVGLFTLWLMCLATCLNSRSAAGPVSLRRRTSAALPTRCWRHVKLTACRDVGSELFSPKIILMIGCFWFTLFTLEIISLSFISN